jgi:hypothetical protein
VASSGDDVVMTWVPHGTDMAATCDDMLSDVAIRGC